MTVGKTYYLACVLDRIGAAIELVSLAICLVILIVFATYIYSSLDMWCDEDKYKVKMLKEVIKVGMILFLVLNVVKVAIPTKDEFLIVSMTKDYRPEQIYNMTKEEVRKSIDYAVKKIKEVEKNERIK